MFSKNVFKETMKSNWKLWTIITAILSFFMLVIVVVVGKEAQNMNPMMMGNVAADEAFKNKAILTILAMGFYGMIGFILPLVYIITTGNSLIASQVDRGSMAYTLSTPTSRKEVSLTKMCYLILAVVGMYATLFLMALIGYLIAGLDFPFKDLSLLTLGIILLQLAISGIVFMFSCIFNTSGKSITFGAGVPILFFIFHSLAAYSEQYAFFKIFKYLSINSLYNTTGILAHDISIIPCFIALFIIAVATFIMGHFIFKKKDLPL